MLTRFAPSPTGYLHIGNARTALLCWLAARKEGGQFMLRIDDTDVERSKEEFVDGIKRDLTWMGLNWDKEMRQSQRLQRYKDEAEKLKAQGRVYPCYETEQELDIKRKMLLSRGKPPIYDRAALKLTAEEISKYEAEGRKPHWRFKLDDSPIVWNDLIRGEVKFEAKHLNDPIIIREDGSFTYLFPSVIDDVDHAVTHVIRGEDHVTNTASQIQMFTALGAPAPHFAHNALIKSKEGKLSKRDGGFTIGALRDLGIEPLAIHSFLARLGTSHTIDISPSMQALVDEFSFSAFSRSPTIYAEEDIERLNKKLLHQMPYSTVKQRLSDMGLHVVDEDFWNTVRPNISTLSEVKDWWNMLQGEVQAELNHEERAFVRATVSQLPLEPWDETTYDRWITGVKATTERKGKELFLPLRQALIGRNDGPELKKLLPLIGYKTVAKRLHL